MNKDIFVICEQSKDKGIAKKILVDKLEKFIVKNMNKDKCYIELIDGNKIYFMTDYELNITYKGYRPYNYITFSWKSYYFVPNSYNANKIYKSLEDEEFYNLIIKTLCEINKDKKWLKGEK